MAKITLKAARVNAGLSQAELAEKMGVSRDAIIAWENGKRPIRPIYLFKLCSVVEFSEDDILLPEITT